MQFEAGFLPGGDAMSLDLARYARGNPVLPGTYDVDIWMNDEWQVRRAVRFVEHDAGNDASPCLTRTELESFGLIKVPASPSEDACAPLSGRIPHALVRFDVGEQRLDIEVPQASMVRHVRGVAPREQWDHGVTAALLAWRANVHSETVGHRSRRYLFFTDDAGFNLGRYRLRHAGAWSRGAYRQGHTFLEHPVEGLDARWRLGELMLGDDLLEPAFIRGFRLATDTRMRSATGDGYVPQVRGVASTHARVKVSQAGVLLTELSVPPGPFVIDDLAVTGRGGDLDVEIIEADGRRLHSRVPYFSLPQLLREGDTRYAVGLGRWRGDSTRRPWLTEASWRRGLGRGWTVQVAHRMLGRATWLVGGAAVDTLSGAFSADVTHAAAKRGAAGATLWRLRYGRASGRGAVLSAALSSGVRQPVTVWTDSDHARVRRHRLDLSYQRLFDEIGGSLGVGLGYMRLPGANAVECDQTLSWSRLTRIGTLDVSLHRSMRTASRYSRRASDTTAQVSFALPLGGSQGRSSAQVAVRLEPEGTQRRAGVVGAVGQDAPWGYAASVATRRRATRLDASMSRQFSSGDLSVAIDRSGTRAGASLSASGGIVAHAGGITLAPYLGTTPGLVRATHARGARLASSASVRIDRRGYAVVPDLAPYRWNSVDVDPTGLPLGVTFVSTHARIVPTAGSVVRIAFGTDEHPMVLFTGYRGDGSPLPFGADIVDALGRSVGVIGQGGQAFLRMDDGATPSWTVRWSGQGSGECALRPMLRGERVGLKHYEGVCR